MSTAQRLALPYFAHPAALVESDAIGPRTRIWAFAHILPTARIGADCNICDHVLVENGAVLGDRVTVKNFVVVGDGVTLEDDVFVGPNVGFTNDRFPRSRQWPAEYLKTRVKRGASIGANASILPGLTIGAQAMVGAGTVVTRDVPPRAIVMGNPGRVTGYVDLNGRTRVESVSASDATPRKVLPGGATLSTLPKISDSRGQLSFAQLGAGLPFPVERYFLVFGVPNSEIRGEHAHKTLQQFLVCTSGSCRVRLFDGVQDAEVSLCRPDLGLHVPAMVWTTQYKYSADAVLFVLASDCYRAEDYIRDMDQYLAEIGQAKPLTSAS